MKKFSRYCSSCCFDSNDLSKMATHALHLEVVEPDVIDAENGGKAPGRYNSDHRVNDAEGGMSSCSTPYSET
jgi:hypothetical protein